MFEMDKHQEVPSCHGFQWDTTEYCTDTIDYEVTNDTTSNRDREHYIE